MDRRLYPATAGIAHLSLEGQTNLPLTAGQTMTLSVPLANLLRAPGGARERQLALGESFCVIDREQGHAFGFAEKDGYCGWLDLAHLGEWTQATHWVATPGTHLYQGPRAQSRDLAALSLGAQVRVIGQSGVWAETPIGFVPVCHLLPMGQHRTDPVSVAEGFLNTPYLWGGNSRAGLDCSGLAQMAHLACGIPFPGDSDLQEAVGLELPADATLQRGDLLFWREHIALVVDGTRLIHANGHSMSVTYEQISACIARIALSGGGPATHRRRL